MTEINAERLNQNSSDASSIIIGMLERLLLTKEPSENLVSLLGSLAPALPICFGTTDAAEAATRQLLDLSKRVKLD